MKSNDGIKSFESKKEAEILLNESRKRIDEIDNSLFDLISERTSLAEGIALSKHYLGMPVYDKSREEAIHNKIKRMAMENDLDEDIIDQIIDMLTILSKNKQEEIVMNHYISFFSLYNNSQRYLPLNLYRELNSIYKTNDESLIA